MSGILALLDRGRLSSPSPAEGGGTPAPSPALAELERLTEVMTYRAADGVGTWQQGAVGLGHALFRTHTPGEQTTPGVVHDPEAGLHIVADARLDARDELVRHLRGAGARTPSGDPRIGSPAPELLLAAWQAWGRHCPDHLIGVFAFVIWDARRRTLFAARDAFGVKPLFITDIDGPEGVIAISNTLPVLLEHPQVSWEPDEASIADHLLWGGIEDERRTYFARIRQVERGSWVAVTPEGVEGRIWWALPEPEVPLSRPRGEVLEEFGILLKAAVRDRLPADGHNAVLQLSGGLDSGAIAAAAVELRGGPEELPAVTYGYERLIQDVEPPVARLTASALRLTHDVMYVDDWTEALPGMAESLPQWTSEPLPWPVGPGLDGADVMTPPLAGLGRVTLTGWDGDAVLYGDAPAMTFDLLRRGRGFALIGQIVLMGRHVAALQRFPRAGFRGALRSTLTGQAADPLAGYPDGWFRPDFERHHDLKGRWRDATTSDDARGGPRYRSRTSLEGSVWSGLFGGQDPSATGQLLEARHPLMDRRLVEFFMALPVVPWCVEKGILRLWLRPRLPTGIWRRPKQGLRGDPLLSLLRQRATGAEGLARIRALLEPHAQHPTVSGRCLRADWNICFLEAIAGDDEDPWPAYRGTYAHAVARWLRTLESC